MQGNLTLRSFGLLCISITLGSFGQVFLKKGLWLWAHVNSAHGVQTLSDPHSIVHTIANIISAMQNPWVLLGLGIYAFSTFFWLVVISRVRLSVAYPLISMSYPLVVVLAWRMLPDEHPIWTFAIAGLLFISAGVSFIGIGLGKSRKETAA